MAHNAFAKKHGDDDSGDSDDSDDSDSGGDKDSDDTGDGEENPDKDQPPVTAGGLFTLKTYPTSEIARPLTITKGITQLRSSIGTDISAKGAFETAGVSLDAVYGVRDNFTLIAGMDTAYNFQQFTRTMPASRARWSTTCSIFGSPPTFTAVRSRR